VGHRGPDCVGGGWTRHSSPFLETTSGNAMTYSDALLALYRDLPTWLKWLLDPAVFVAFSLGLAILGLVSLLALPWLLARIPVDYLVAASAPARRGSAGSLGRVVRNVLGGLVMLLGIAMLVLPGQGVLTILAALVLLDFPGKRRLERWFILRPRVFGALNSLRARVGRPPLERPARCLPTASSRS
jgi:hypothetical protein